MKQKILVIFEPLNARGKDRKRAPYLTEAINTIVQNDFVKDKKIIVENLPKNQLSQEKIARLRKNHQISCENTYVVTSDLGNAVEARDAGAHVIGVTWRESMIRNGVAMSGMPGHGASVAMIDFSEFAGTLAKLINKNNVPKIGIPVMRAKREYQ